MLNKHVFKLLLYRILESCRFDVLCFHINFPYPADTQKAITLCDEPEQLEAGTRPVQLSRAANGNAKAFARNHFGCYLCDSPWLGCLVK